MGRDGGGGERDEECWSFVLFLDRVASSAHPPTRYAPKALQSGLDVEERKGAGRAETESSLANVVKGFCHAASASRTLFREPKSAFWGGRVS